MAITAGTYSTVEGYFLQDEGTPLGGWGAAILPKFGLILPSWTELLQALIRLNQNASKGTLYKLFILGRHGEGYHNVAEAKYGTQAWDDYWAKLDGDDEITWGPDALLTPTGELQASEAHDMWDREHALDMPHPKVYYCSPLTRSLQTCVITFDGIFSQSDLDARRVILENCREEYGEHTCDKRRSRSYIVSKFPQFAIEGSFPEEDELWRPDERETPAHVAQRAKEVLDYVFEKDDEAVISLTAHSGFINGFLTAVNHKPYALPTGGVIPVVVECKQP